MNIPKNVQEYISTLPPNQQKAALNEIMRNQYSAYKNSPNQVNQQNMEKPMAQPQQKELALPAKLSQSPQTQESGNMQQDMQKLFVAYFQKMGFTEQQATQFMQEFAKLSDQEKQQVVQELQEEMQNQPESAEQPQEQQQEAESGMEEPETMMSGGSRLFMLKKKQRAAKLQNGGKKIVKVFTDDNDQVGKYYEVDDPQGAITANFPISNSNEITKDKYNASDDLKNRWSLDFAPPTTTSVATPVVSGDGNTPVTKTTTTPVTESGSNKPATKNGASDSKTPVVTTPKPKPVTTKKPVSKGDETVKDGQAIINAYIMAYKPYFESKGIRNNIQQDGIIGNQTIKAAKVVKDFIEGNNGKLPFYLPTTLPESISKHITPNPTLPSDSSAVAPTDTIPSSAIIDSSGRKVTMGNPADSSKVKAAADSSKTAKPKATASADTGKLAYSSRPSSIPASTAYTVTAAGDYTPDLKKAPIDTRSWDERLAAVEYGLDATSLATLGGALVLNPASPLLATTSEVASLGAAGVGFTRAGMAAARGDLKTAGKHAGTATLGLIPFGIGKVAKKVKGAFTAAKSVGEAVNVADKAAPVAKKVLSAAEELQLGNLQKNLKSVNETVAYFKKAVAIERNPVKIAEMNKQIATFSARHSEIYSEISKLAAKANAAEKVAAPAAKVVSVADAAEIARLKTEAGKVTTKVLDLEKAISAARKAATKDPAAISKMEQELEAASKLQDDLLEAAYRYKGKAPVPPTPAVVTPVPKPAVVTPKPAALGSVLEPETVLAKEIVKLGSELVAANSRLKSAPTMPSFKAEVDRLTKAILDKQAELAKIKSIPPSTKQFGGLRYSWF